MEHYDQGMTKATCAIDMRFGPEEREEALRLLVLIAAQTEAHRGCVLCHAAVNAADAAEVHYREEWDSDSAFRKHVQSEEFRRLLILVDLCVEEPRVLVEQVSWHRGLARLKALRAGQDTGPPGLRT